MADSNPHHRMSLHQLLGGGSVADVLLWRKWCGGVLLLVSSTTLWFLFERGGYNLLSFVANVLLLLVVILFFWAKSASLLNRPLPPLPDMEISEETIVKVADAMRMYINYALSIARGIAIGRNLKLFLKVAFGLWVASYVGSFFNFLTLVYVGVLLSLSVPVLYDKYQDHIDERLCVMHRVIQTQYRKIDESLLKKIPIPMMKEKKIQVSSSSESVVTSVKMGVQHMKLLRFLFAGMLLVLMSNASYSGNPLGAGLTPIASTFGRTFNFLFFVFLGETHIIDKYWSAAFKSFLLYFTCSFPLDDPPMLEGMLTSGNGNQIYISLVFSSQRAFCVFVAMPIQPPGKAVTFLVS